MLNPLATPLASVEKNQNSWRLQVPAGPGGNYRLAQLDNYSSLSRRNFPVTTPANLSLCCRASSTDSPGTWGFGFWNDPFAVSLGLHGMARRLPVFPNACWFFNASPENHLSFHDHLPGSGLLAQTFRSPKIPSSLLLTGVIAVPLLYVKILSKWLRKFSGRIIAEDTQLLNLNTTQWHVYDLSWDSNTVIFKVDHSIVFQTQISPRGPLGAVIWIDNQYAAWPAAGKPSMGTLRQTRAEWLEIDQLEIKF